MNFVQSATINSNLLWTQRDITNGVTTIDQGQVSYEQLFPSGTGTSQVGSVFYSTGTLSTLESRRFDLINLTRSVFGATLTTNFSGGKVKIINIENLSTGIIINLISTGVGSFGLNLLGSSSGVSIYPESYYNIINSSGFNIGSGNRYFYVNNTTSNPALFQISILGNTI